MEGQGSSSQHLMKHTWVRGQQLIYGDICCSYSVLQVVNTFIYLQKVIQFTFIYIAPFTTKLCGRKCVRAWTKLLFKMSILSDKCKS